MVFFGDIVTADPPVNICLVTNDIEASDMTIERLVMLGTRALYWSEWLSINETAGSKGADCALPAPLYCCLWG